MVVAVVLEGQQAEMALAVLLAGQQAEMLVVVLAVLMVVVVVV